MAEIKPRWEWRTFGTRFARAEAAFALFETKGVQETDEIYLLETYGKLEVMLETEFGGKATGFVGHDLEQRLLHLV